MALKVNYELLLDVFTDIHMRCKVQINYRSLPGLLKMFSDKLSKPTQYHLRAACLQQGLTGTLPSVLGDEP